MKKLIGVSALLTLSLPAAAQTPIAGRVGAAMPPNALIDKFRKSARPLTPAEMQRPNSPFVKLVLVPSVPWVAISALVSADTEAMKGWAPLTNGATQGGVTLFRMDKTTRVVVRAADGYLYVTDIDPANPASPISAGAWQKTSLHPSSEADCQRGEGKSQVLCAALGNGGSAQISWLYGVYNSGSQNMGGSNAGARPTIYGAPYAFECACDDSGNPNPTAYGHIESNTLFVWDGAKGLFRRRTFTYTPYAMTGLGYMSTGQPAQDIAPQYAGWKRMAGEFSSPIGCLDDQCAVMSGNSVSLFDPNYLSTDKPLGMAVGKPIPGGVGTTKTAPVIVKTSSGITVIVARNAAGRLYQSVNGGDWRDEGGAARAGSQMACLTTQEQPTCFIQGPDGRIWWKHFKTASGL